MVPEAPGNCLGEPEPAPLFAAPDVLEVGDADEDDPQAARSAASAPSEASASTRRDRT